MKKIQIEKTIKKFDELDEEQQEEILNDYRNINIDFQGWNDYIIIDFIEEVKSKTDLEIETNDIIWETGSRNSKFGVYSKNIVNQLLSKFEHKGVCEIYTTKKLGSFLNHRGGGICFKNHTEYDLAEVYFEEDFNNNNSNKKQNKIVKEQINSIINKVIELCSKYHKNNEEAYNYAISDEAVKETIKSNDYDFDSETLQIY